MVLEQAIAIGFLAAYFLAIVLLGWSIHRRRRREIERMEDEDPPN